MLRVLAVDHEVPALEELLRLLRADPRVARAEGASDAATALHRIARALDDGVPGPGGGGGDAGGAALDVVFMDVRMPGMSGLETARLLTRFRRPPLVVFVTAHEEFAARAFDLEAVDYVLKPVRRERLAEAVRRVSELAADPASAPRRASDDAVIPVELGGVTRFVPVDAVAYVEAHGDYARLHTGAGPGHLVRVPLAALEERWRPRGFVRVHRRYLVALWAVRELRVDAGAVSVLAGGDLLPVSRRHARSLRDLLARRVPGPPRERRSTGRGGRGR
jgi:DNA-binding LytR/AlgR family response regulator